MAENAEGFDNSDLGDCVEDDGTVTVHVAAGAVDGDPEDLDGEQVEVEGEVFEEDDQCEIVADEVRAVDDTTGTGGAGGTGTGTGGSPSPVSSPDETKTPGPADEGAICDETPSVAPPGENRAGTTTLGASSSALPARPAPAARGVTA